MRTSLMLEDARPWIRDLINQIFRDVPCGSGGEGPIALKRPELDQVLAKGAHWVIEQGFGEPRDGEFAEERGCLAEADPSQVSERAKNRGRLQLGTIGSGNHFLEVQYVEQIHDRAAAAAMELLEDQVVVLVHCGYRGLGHQVCTDYLAQMGDAMKKYGITLPDRQLACVPIQSPEGQAYLGAMRAAAN
jgi:tRNA-splicing ligase RtcB